MAYWPGSPESFFAELGTNLDAEIERYAAVIHLRTPPADGGYGRNDVRIESAAEARAIDEKILAAWERHPRRHVVESTTDFIVKVERAIDLIEAEIPDCCARRAPWLVGTPR